MIIPTHLIYEDELSDRTIQGFRLWKADVTGTITELHMWVAGVGLGNWRFNIRQSGAALFNGSSQFIFSPGNLYEAKVGLSIPVTLGDPFGWDLVRRGRGNITSPLELLILTEES